MGQRDTQRINVQLLAQRRRCFRQREAAASLVQRDPLPLPAPGDIRSSRGEGDRLAMLLFHRASGFLGSARVLQWLRPFLQILQRNHKFCNASDQLYNHRFCKELSRRSMRRWAARFPMRRRAPRQTRPPDQGQRDDELTGRTSHGQFGRGA